LATAATNASLGAVFRNRPFQAPLSLRRGERNDARTCHHFAESKDQRILELMDALPGLSNSVESWSQMIASFVHESGGRYGRHLRRPYRLPGSWTGDSTTCDHDSSTRASRWLHDGGVQTVASCVLIQSDEDSHSPRKDRGPEEVRAWNCRHPCPGERAVCILIKVVQCNYAVCTCS
jgi:hypothetical protein